MELSNLLRFKRLFETQLSSSSPLSIEPQIMDPTEPSDDLDRASLIQEQLLISTFQNRKVITMQAARDALSRIRVGSFGICEECGEEIDLRRLEIHPVTPFCIHCQEEYEFKGSLRMAI